MITDYNNIYNIHNGHYTEEKYSVVNMLQILECYYLLNINHLENRPIHSK